MIVQLRVLLALFFILILSSATSTKQIEQTQPTPKSKTGYKTSEQIEKAPSENHPCNLTRTSLKISFPELKNELFVNILGYREPNLVTLWQCRGFCGNSGSQISCLPLKITQNSVNMMFQSNSSGETQQRAAKSSFWMNMQSVDVAATHGPHYSVLGGSMMILVSVSVIFGGLGRKS